MLKRTQYNPSTFLRYGLPRTKDLLKDINRLYDGLVIPANILLYQYKSTPAIIYHINKPYFIDPMSYLFAHPFNRFKKRIEKGETFKPSFDKLLKGYGMDTTELLTLDAPLTDILSNSDELLKIFVDNCIYFQLNQVKTVISEASEFIEVENLEKLDPIFLVPPYFLYKANDKVSELNLKILEYCKQKTEEWGNPSIFPMVFIDQETLTDKYISDLSAQLNNLGFDGYCIWIQNFDERIVQKNQISSVIKLVKALSQDGAKQIVSLFGGFFSLLLNKFGLNAVCHGLLYSEHKSINSSTDQTSGPAPVRYYISGVHQFLTLEKALPVLRKRNDLICDCPICQRVIQGNPENVFNFNKEENLAIMHFLYRRYEEKQMASKQDLDGVISYLEFLYAINEDLNQITDKDKSIMSVDSLKNWKNAISENK